MSERIHQACKQQVLARLDYLRAFIEEERYVDVLEGMINISGCMECPDREVDFGIPHGYPEFPSECTLMIALLRLLELKTGKVARIDENGRVVTREPEGII